MISRLHDYQNTITQHVNINRPHTMNFTIKKGNHYSQLRPILLKPSEHFGMYEVIISFEGRPFTQDFYSKLIGYGVVMPRLRSERIGWRFIEGNQVELVIYSEINYKFYFSKAMTVPIEYNATSRKMEVKFKIHLDDNCIMVTPLISGEGRYIAKTFTKITSFLPLVLCKPYHGGNPVAEFDYYFTFTKLL
jgi:hypothetical protein